MTNILVFGDSIGQGYYDKQGGWVDRLKKYFLEQEILHNWEQSINVFNLSLSGDTTNEILSRFEKEIKPRTWNNHKIIATFSVGINDSIIINGRNKTPNIQFVKNLKKLFLIAKRYANKIIFVGLTPVEESKVTPLPWSPEESYFEKEVTKYDKIIQNFCKENKLEYVYLYNKLITKDLSDGVHPNTKGHKKIFEAVKNFLEKKNII